MDIELERALEVIEAAVARKASGGGRSTGGRAAKKNVLKELGEHPNGGPVQVLDGRYGPYVSYQKVNVTLPKEVKPEAVTLDQALGWIADKAGSKPATPAKKATKPKVGATKASATKAATPKAASAKTSSTKTAAAKSGSAKKATAKKVTAKKAPAKTVTKSKA